MNSQCLALFQQPKNFIAQANAKDWTQLIHEAREQGLFGSIYCYLQQQHYFSLIPEKVQHHLWSGFVYAEKQKSTLVLELLELEQTFADVSYPCLLVKGAAYRVAGYHFAQGRIFSDIDILVPPSHFEDARLKLQNAGYLEFACSEYDQNYYRRWSHQNPPLTHYIRGAGIDLHHHIFPVSSKENISVEPLISNATALSGSVFSTPSGPYLFVHAAVHLFYQDESHKLVKDLVDLWQLYQEIRQQHDLSALVDAAQQTNTQAAVFYALDTLQWLFNVEIDPHSLQGLTKYASPGLRPLLRTMLSGHRVSRSIAHQIWFIRGHLLKMGPFTLSYHLIAKSWHQLLLKRKLSTLQQAEDAQTRPRDAGLL